MSYGEWKPIKAEVPAFKCHKCSSSNVWYRDWESSCGGYEDYQYKCQDCQHSWPEWIR